MLIEGTSGAEVLEGTRGGGFGLVDLSHPEHLVGMCFVRYLASRDMYEQKVQSSEALFLSVNDAWTSSAASESSSTLAGTFMRTCPFQRALTECGGRLCCLYDGAADSV